MKRNKAQNRHIPKPRSIRKSFFSSAVPGWPSKKFSGLTSPCTNLTRKWSSIKYEVNWWRWLEDKQTIFNWRQKNKTMKSTPLHEASQESIWPLQQCRPPYLVTFCSIRCQIIKHKQDIIEHKTKQKYVHVRLAYRIPNIPKTRPKHIHHLKQLNKLYLSKHP